MKYNPSLRMSIEMTEQGYTMVEDSDSKPRLVTLHDTGDWKKVMEDEMVNEIPDANAPQFRCTYMPHVKYEGSEGSEGNEASKETNVVGFVFTFNHAIIGEPCHCHAKPVLMCGILSWVSWAHLGLKSGKLNDR